MFSNMDCLIHLVTWRWGGGGGGGRVKYSGLTVKKAIEECFNDLIIAAVVATGYATQILMICIIQAFI